MTPEEKRERHADYQRRWRAANPEKAREINRRSKARKPAYMREWRAANPTRERQNQRRWREANPEKVQQKNSRWYAAHPEEAREAAQRARYARPEDIAQMYEAQQGKCYLCGDLLPAERRKWVVEHDHRCCPEGRSCRYCRRGIACVRCNTLIGLAGDDPQRLRHITANLEAAIIAVTQRLAGRAIQAELFELSEAGEALWSW